MKVKLTTLFVCTLALNACALHKLTNKQQLCEQAKRQQIFNSTMPQIDSHNTTDKQKEKLAETIQTDCESNQS